ncbi:hypothetical protein THUN1379_26950 [Paludibacterium sp. THUN1379]|uniref:hypothetical protein n=1 Tax=Paludibacterium sp. THUN1379 TaxID=3112107 RepID=UPI0030917FA7|nr:hypothetical protein THUN1379_26950 [Paludibacterium sp. THUN1379]
MSSNNSPVDLGNHLPKRIGSVRIVFFEGGVGELIFENPGEELQARFARAIPSILSEIGPAKQPKS